MRNLPDTQGAAIDAEVTGYRDITEKQAEELAVDCMENHLFLAEMEAAGALEKREGDA